VDFARALPAERLQPIEAALAELMESYSEKYDLTASETAEIDQRMAEKNPEYSSKYGITDIFGEPFSA